MDELIKLLPVIIPTALALIWFIRLEAKVMYLERDHAKLEDAVKEKDKMLWQKIDNVRDDITKILEAIARLDGRLSSDKRNPNA